MSNLCHIFNVSKNKTQIVEIGYWNVSYVGDNTQDDSTTRAPEESNTLTTTQHQTHTTPTITTTTTTQTSSEIDFERGDSSVTKADVENNEYVTTHTEQCCQTHCTQARKLGECKCSREVCKSDEREDVPDGGWGYAVSVGCFVIMTIVNIKGPCFGVLFSGFLLENGETSTTIGWLFSASTALFSLGSLLVAPAVREFGHRKVAFVGALMTSLGMCTSAFATSAWHLFISYCIIESLGSGVLSIVSLAILPNYFIRHLGRANAFISAGVCMGQMVGPPLVTYLQQMYGFRGASLIVGALTLNNVEAAALFHPVEWHIKHPTHKKEATLEGKVPQHTSTKPRVIVILFQGILDVAGSFRLFKSPKILILVFCSSLTAVGSANFFVFMPAVMAERGFTQEEAAWCMSVSGICNLVIRLLVSLLTDCPRFSKRGCYMAGSFILGLTVVVFCFVKELWLVAAVMGVWGVGVGAFMSLYNLILLEYVGKEKLMQVLGLVAFVNGMIRDLSGSYTISIYVLSFTAFIAVIIWFFLPAAIAYEQRKETYQREQ
ncbi:Monocarboxylate transporter 12-like 3 [Homarus americanus]|uniref:Monocarboxylate transporter 12-like 3 n=1 Tax=Homarus americanus TaxID=6706 RepID=A0A8J5JWG0_HOMAM|nr:Monocarboxylate transporter 12-like 3 [Homarus americanus]